MPNIINKNFQNIKNFFYATTHNSDDFCSFMKDIKFNNIDKFDNLANILADEISILKNNIDLIISIPKFKDEINEADFSLRIAKIVSNKTNIPYSNSAIIKTKKTRKLRTIPKEQREKEIENAFIIKDLNYLKNKKICIVDDVLSSGNTLKEIIKTLLKVTDMSNISVAILVVQE